MNHIEEEIEAIERGYRSMARQVSALIALIEDLRAKPGADAKADRIRHLDLKLLELRDFLNSQ